MNLFEYTCSKTTLSEVIMETYIGIGVALILGILFIIYLCKYHKNFFFNFLLRAVFGITCIYLLNAVIGEVGLHTPVGINGISVLMVSVFGIPGLILLYGGSLVLRR